MATTVGEELNFGRKFILVPKERFPTPAWRAYPGVVPFLNACLPVRIKRSEAGKRKEKKKELS